MGVIVFRHMLVTNQKMKDVEDFMKKLDNDVRERKVTDFRMARLQNEIRIMSKDRMSVQRSGNMQRIERFNNLFVSKLSELSKIMQTNGFTNRDEIAKMVRRIKSQ
jgi:hypothetical protein